MTTRRLARGAVFLLLFFLAGLALFRARAFVGGGGHLDGYRESMLPWAYRDASLPALLRRVAPSLWFGEHLWIEVPSSGGRFEPGWFRVMASYAWPNQYVLGVGARRAVIPVGVTRIAIDEAGSVRILRSGGRVNGPL